MKIPKDADSLLKRRVNLLYELGDIENSLMSFLADNKIAITGIN